MARRSPELSAPLTAGILAASGLMYARVSIWTVAIAPALARRVVVPLLILFVLVEGAAAVTWWRSARKQKIDPQLDMKNPVTVTSALQFGALYATVIVVAKGLIERLSAASLSVVGAASGINDVDAITLATSNLVRDGGVGVGPAAKAVIAAVTVNTIVKGVLAVSIGGTRLAVGVASVLGPAAVAGVVIWFLV